MIYLDVLLLINESEMCIGMYRWLFHVGSVQFVVVRL